MTRIDATDQPNGSSRLRGFATIGGIYLATLLFTALVYPFVETDSAGPFRFVVGQFRFGVGLGQVGLLAAWAALAPFAMLKSLPQAYLALLASSLATSANLWFWDDVHAAPYALAAFLGELLTFALLTGLLSTFRFGGGWRLVMGKRANDNSQFSILEILTWMALLGGLTAGILAFTKVFRMPDIPSMNSFLFTTLLTSVVCTLLASSSPLLIYSVFATATRRIRTGLAFAVLLQLAIAAPSAIIGGYRVWEALVGSACWVAGFNATVLGAMAMLKWAGVRLEREWPASPRTPSIPIPE